MAALDCNTRTMDLQPHMQITCIQADFTNVYKLFSCCITIKSNLSRETTAFCSLLTRNNFRAATLTSCFLRIKRETYGEPCGRSGNCTETKCVWSGNRARQPWHCFLADCTFQLWHSERLILTHCCDFDSASHLFSQKNLHKNIIMYHVKYYSEQGLGRLFVITSAD